MAAKKKGGGGNLTRSQVVTVRLDPKLKFSAELAARKQRRTVSSFIEWAVEEAIGHLDAKAGSSFNDLINRVWDVEEADRFLKLAVNYPDLLTYDEEKIWKLLIKTSTFWNHEKGSEHLFNESTIDFYILRKNWNTLIKIVSGEAEEADLDLAPF